MIIDCFLFYNEFKLLDFRLKYLSDTVEHFVICEAKKTFSGKDKELFFDKFKLEYSETYNRFKDKIVHLIVDDLPNGTTYESNWTREKYQRNYLLKGVLQLKPSSEDLVLLTDVDEIPDRNTLRMIKNAKSLDKIYCLVMDMYYYNLECRYSRKWFHPKIIPFKFMNNKTDLDGIRLSGRNGINNGGWHFSYFGDENFIINKLESFSHQEFNNSYYKDKNRIKEMIKSNRDLFERNELVYNYIEPKDNTYLPEGYEELL